MVSQEAEFAGHVCDCGHRTIAEMQGFQHDGHHTLPPFNHGCMALQSHQESFGFELSGIGHSCGVHEENAAAELSSCTCAPPSDYCRYQNHVSTDANTCHRTHNTTSSGQVLHGGAVGNMCHVQHHCHHHHTSHCVLPVYQNHQMPVQEAGPAVEGVAQSPKRLIDEEPVEYEYYVWDAAAQEYVQTDKQTGEKMLQDPQYFQYHYRLVENTLDGETRLLPEPFDEFGCPELNNLEFPSKGGLVDANQNFLEHVEDTREDGLNLPHGTGLLNTPKALVTPRRKGCYPPSSKPHVGCLHASRNSPRCHHHELHDKENGVSSRFAAHNRMHENKFFEEVNECDDCGVEELLRGSYKTTRCKHRGPVADGRGNRRSNMKLSYSRPWENASVSMRDKELQIRQLRHLQQVQALEKEELLRRQTMLDEMAASLPKTSKQLVTRTGRVQTALSTDLRTSGKKTYRPSGIPGGGQRARSDPVNRGRYFREKWKSDRFLEQQRHPAFDVKAYDAWLKSSGHLLRARALELQQEEQRLIALLQQERSSKTKYCGY